MGYQVIARKYRPQRFSDVVGQEHVTQTLARAIEQNRIAHAYLFCGPRGTGKTTIARIFAKCLNCTDGPRVEFDDNDPRCREIAEGRSIDVLEIDGASNNGVEQVRELRETAKYAPASSKFKIYIIDEVHMLSTAAFNALLKTLEEPPAHVKFMFATTDPEKVLATILSRCQRFDLRRIPVALIVQHLEHIARQEQVQVDPAALYAIARGADGGMRDAESALDQLISFCGEHVEESDVLSMFGLTAQGQILALTSALLNGDARAVLRDVNELAKHGKDLGRLLADLLNHFRNLLILQVSEGDPKVLEVSEAEIACLQEQSALVPTEGLTRIMEVLSDAEGRLRDAASKKIFLEVALLKAIQARKATSIDTVLKQLNDLRAGTSAEPRPASAERRSAPSDRRSPAPQSAPAPRPAAEPSRASGAAAAPPAPSVAAPAAPAAVGNPHDLGQLWQALLDAVGRASAFTRSYLQNARPVGLERKVLTVAFDPEFADQFELVNTSKTQTLLQTKLQELGHPGAQVRFVKAEGGPATPTPPPPARTEPAPARPAPAASAAPASRPAPAAPAPALAAESPRTAPAAATQPAAMNLEDFKNDPLIQRALEIFKGQIAPVA